MHRGHTGRVRTSGRALFDLTHRFFECADGWVAVTRVDVALLLAAKDLIDLLHRVVGECGAGVDRCRDRLTRGWRLSFAGVYELRCDVALLWFCHQRYRSPPSQSTVTTTAGDRRDAASLQAANTFAPELGPT